MRTLSLAAPFVLLAVHAVAQTNFPPPIAPAGNPVTYAKEMLGKALFFEEQLSSTGTVACATCHDFARGGADGRAATSVHPGADGLRGTTDDVRGSPGVAVRTVYGLVGSAHYGFGPQVTGRRAPTVINSAYHPSLFYDGRAATGDFRDPLTHQVVLTGNTALENLVLGPPVNAVEMGHEGRTWLDVAQKIATASPLVWASELPPQLQGYALGRSYPSLFQQAFGSPDVTPARIAMAIATYIRTLNADQSPFDRHLRGTYSLTPQEQAGLVLFRTPRLGATACNVCHGDFETRVLTEGPIAGAATTTSTGYYGSSVTTRLLFHNIGLRPVAEDPGRGGITSLPVDAGRFRTAALRNVALTAPYFHNGSAASLRDVIDFYDRGGDFHANQAPSLLPRQYTRAEKDALIAILMTLTDPRVATGLPPFDRPRLGSENGRLPTAIGAGMQSSSGRILTAQAPVTAQLGEQAFCVTLSGASPGSFTFLMWDTETCAPNPAQWNLVLALSANWQPFAIGPVRYFLSMPGNGVQVVPVPLPNHPSFRGLRLYAQWLVSESVASGTFLTSNGLRIELQ